MLKIEEKITVCPIPGVSAETYAVSISGFIDQYLFYGFLTKKEKELENLFKNLCNIDYSLVFFIPAKNITKIMIRVWKYII